MQAQVTFRIVLEPDEVTYSVYMTSATAYMGFPALITTSQITVLVPHGTGTDRFGVTGITSPIPNMRWTLNTRIDAPIENPQVDYLFFSFSNNTNTFALFDIVADQSILLFQFKRTGNCLGGVQLIDNKADLFLPPNSVGANSGNSMAILGGGVNVYRGNTDTPPTVTIQPLTGILCAGQSVTLTATLTPTVSDPIVYEWFLNEKSIAPASANPQLTYVLPRSTGLPIPVLRVRATLRGTTRCRDQTVTAIQKLTIVNPPDASLTYTGDVCTELPVVLPVTPTSGASYLWLNKGVVIAGVTGASLTVTASGTYSVSVTAGGCSTLSKPVRLVGVAKAERTTVTLGPSQTVVAGTAAQLQATLTNAASFTWTPANTLSDPQRLDPQASPRQTTTYTLRAESASGCPAQDSVAVVVLPGLLIPNTFTPNGDGMNDTWVIYNVDRYRPCTVTVVDRWGTVIFYADPYTNPGWDGQMAGQPVPVGIYHYVIRTGIDQQSGSLYIGR